MRMTSRGGPAKPLTRLQPNEFTHRWPQFLPGGQAVLFTSNTTPTWWSHGRVEALSLADGRRKLVQDRATFGRFVADANGNGYLTFMRGGVLFAAPFDPVRLELTGQPFPVLDGVAYDNTGAAHVDLSRTGTIVARTQPRFRLAWLESSGSARVFGEAGDYEAPALSRDGSRVAYSSTGDLWVYDVERDVRTQVTRGSPSRARSTGRRTIASSSSARQRVSGGPGPTARTPNSGAGCTASRACGVVQHERLARQPSRVSRGDHGRRLDVGPLDHSRRPRRRPRGGAAGAPPNRRGRTGVRPVAGRPMGRLCRERERWPFRHLRPRVSRRRTPMEGADGGGVYPRWSASRSTSSSSPTAC